MVIVVVMGWSLGGHWAAVCAGGRHIKGSAERVLKRIRDAGAVVDDRNSAGNMCGKPKEMCRISASERVLASHLMGGASLAVLA